MARKWGELQEDEQFSVALPSIAGAMSCLAVLLLAVGRWTGGNDFHWAWITAPLWVPVSLVAFTGVILQAILWTWTEEN